MSNQRVVTRAVLAMLAAVLVGATLIAGPAARDTVGVFRFSDGTAVGGAASTLARTDAGVSMTLRTSDLDPGAAYTVWWVIFNNPENCSAPGCSLDDLEDPALQAAVNSAVGFAAGHIVSRDGTGNFGGHVSVGDSTGFFLGTGLWNPRGAEVHLVVRSHGQPIPGRVKEQIATFDGGCDVNVCVDKQFAMHLTPTP